MTKEQIKDRINNPTKHYTIESLKKVAEDNNIIVDRNIRKNDLIEQLKDRKLLNIPPEPIVESNLGVKFSDALLKSIREAKRKARNAREDLANYKNYIKSLNNEILTSKRFKKILKEVKKREIKAKEEHDKIFTVREGEKALKNFAKVYVIDGTTVYEPREFLFEARVPITEILRTNKETKVKMLFTCDMKRDVLDYGFQIKTFYFYSHNEINLRATDENEIYDKMIDRIEEEIQKLEEAEGTGWTLHEVKKLELFTVEWAPLRGSSYIKLPEYLKNKNAIINMKNMDNKCFLWSVLRALNPVRSNGEKIDKILKYKENTLKMKGIKYPVSIKDINKFESLNSNISITVLGYDEKKNVYPLRVSPYKNRDNKINFLLIEEEGKSHYCLINNLSRLISMQVNKYKVKCFICDNCLNPFNSEYSRNKHKEYCCNNECVKINMPEKGSILKFKNFCNSERMPFYSLRGYRKFTRKY